MREVREAQTRLEAALTAGDLQAVREAARALAARCLTLGDSGGSLAHADRLADLGLQAAATVHELRQPLAGIKAIAQLVASSPEDPGLVIERACTIERYAEIMEALCDRLRAYARAEPARPQPGDANAAIQAALEMLKQLLRSPPVSVATDLAPNLPAAALDSVGIQQIVVNLVRNAHEALAAQPGNIRIATRAAGDALEVVVSDDGPGISPAIAERLFGAFATNKPTGSGLGLWLSRRLAAEAGGSLEHVAGGTGATFRLRLPIARTT